MKKTIITVFLTLMVVFSMGTMRSRYTPINTDENAVSLLSTTTVSLAADADTTIYTVPAGKTCILSHAVLVAGADAATSDISIGQNSAETDFVPASDLQHIDASGDTCILQPIPAVTVLKVEAYAAGTVIEAKVTNQAGGASNTVYLFGTLY